MNDSIEPGKEVIFPGVFLFFTSVIEQDKPAGPAPTIMTS